MFIFSTSRAVWIVSFSDDEHAASLGARAPPRRRRRCRDCLGPSALIAVAGRIEPTSTTGLSLFTTRSRKYAVSSIVSVPCVMTTPSTSVGLEHLVHALGELEPDLVVHVLAADVRDLLAGELRQVLHLRHGLDQVLDLERARL